MLQSAAVLTADFRALSETTDFNFVVGRRGTGKSALHQALTHHFRQIPDAVLIAHAQSETGGIILRDVLKKYAGGYGDVRALARLAWRWHLVFSTLTALRRSRRVPSLESYWADHHGAVTYFSQFSGAEQCAVALKFVLGAQTDISLGDKLAQISRTLEVDRLTSAVRDTLETLSRRVVFLFDGLDEGWTPDPEPTAILGGLAKAAAEISDSSLAIHPILFVRDNMFRALASLDPDYSRNIEASTLRLNWTPEQLFRVIAARIRVAFRLDGESDAKVWNRVAQRGLSGYDGFERCLRHTLYRPRDLLVLLNLAFVGAARAGRNSIVDDDIEQAARTISNERLDDLSKEYDRVFPGLTSLIAMFSGWPKQSTQAEIVRNIDAVIMAADGEKSADSDFAILRTGAQAFLALYSVGFIGVESHRTGQYAFCHDGTQGDLNLAPEQKVVVHPCYWMALGGVLDDVGPAVSIEVSDEYGEKGRVQASDLRIRQFGQVLSELGKIAPGHGGQGQFEEWLLRSVKILFSGRISNVELKPNGASIQRRDIVGSISAERGVWKRIYDDYHCRQIVFEAKNYGELTADDIRQALSYSGNSYGKLVVVVYRTDREGLTANEREWVKEIYDQHKTLVFLVPSVVVSRCIAKMRADVRFEYADDRLAKRLDTFERSYLSLRVTRGGKRA